MNRPRPRPTRVTSGPRGGDEWAIDDWVPFLVITLLGSGQAPSVQDARAAFDRVGVELDRLRDAIIAECAGRDSEACATAVDAYNQIQQGYALAAQAVP